MSRAFVRESDHDDTAPPERVVSRHPNFVTPAGMKQIESQVQALEDERSAARTRADRATLARIARDLRYWTQRRASARVIEPAPRPDSVRFGVRVMLRFENGGERAFRLVGEDQADPARGLVSWVSPLAAALMGRTVGDEVEVLGQAAQIVALDGTLPAAALRARCARR